MYLIPFGSGISHFRLFYPTPKTIEFKLSRDNGTIELEIADDGEGFDPLFQDESNHIKIAGMKNELI